MADGNQNGGWWDEDATKIVLTVLSWWKVRGIFILEVQEMKVFLL